MNILMLGNSFTYCNDMPGMLAEELNASVTEVVRGGAYLHGFLDQEDELSQLGMAALVGEIHECDGRNMCRTFGGRPCGLWDYVVIQEQSFNAVGNPDDYVKSAVELCRRIWSVGAVPVIYGTWGYRDGSMKLKSTWLTFDEMRRRQTAAQTRAAKEGSALLADVGIAFDKADFDVYAPDDYHPNEAASRLAAKTIAETIRAHSARERKRPDVELREVTKDNWRKCVVMQVSEDQRDYVAPNGYSLVQAAYEPDRYPLAVYMDGEVVGFAMYAYDEDVNMWMIYRLMVSHDMQGRGVGRAALQKLVEKIAAEHGARGIAISAEPENVLALGLYRRMGFEPDGRVIGGEIFMIKRV